MQNLKGWRTLLFNLLLIIAPPALAYLAGVHWSDYLSPTWAPVVAGIIGVVLRVVTTTPVGTSKTIIILPLVGLTALFLTGQAHAQTVPLPTPKPYVTKAAQQPFVTGSGWYFGVGTEGGVAASNVSGSSFPSLTSGNLTADGGSVGVDFGYISANCFLSTWCQAEVDIKYQNISGGNSVGSVNDLWAFSGEFDVGANVMQTLTSVIGNQIAFPTFNPTTLLPSAVAVASTPREYLGGVIQATEVSGSIGSISGETFNVALGPKTGWRWQTLNSSGVPNDGSLNVYAEILFANRGVDISGIFSGPGGAPIDEHGSAETNTMYLAGVHYDLGL